MRRANTARHSHVHLMNFTVSRMPSLRFPFARDTASLYIIFCSKRKQNARVFTCQNDAVKTELVYYKQASALYLNGECAPLFYSLLSSPLISASLTNSSSSKQQPANCITSTRVNSYSYEKSAELFSQLKTHPFEEIALKFLQLPEKRPLRLLLSRKMELLLRAADSGAGASTRAAGGSNAPDARRRAQAEAADTLSASDRTQLLVWLVWLIELFLNEMALLRDRSGAPSLPPGVVASAAALAESAKYTQIEAEFRKFLASPPILVRYARA